MKATEKQVNLIYLLSAELGFSKRELFMLTENRKPEELTKQQADKVIRHLKRLKEKGRKGK